MDGALLRAALPPVFDPAGGPWEAGRGPRWGLAGLAGRLVELSAAAHAACLTAAFGLVLEAQLCGDRAAWVGLTESAFFPPDVADGGIDLDALAVARVGDAWAVGRAADHLVRSSGFGLVVLDLVDAPPNASLPVPLLTRLLGHARQHDVVVLILTRKSQEAASLHSLVSLRAEAQSRRQGEQYELSIRVLKDKRSGPGRTHVEICRGPAGVR